MILWDTSQVAFHLYADDTPLTSESSSAELAKLAVEDYCVRDIDAWMTVNKVKMNRDKTEQPRPQGLSLKNWVGREKALASAGHVSPCTP